MNVSDRLMKLADRLEGPNADKIFVAKEFTIRQLILELHDIADQDDAAWETTQTEALGYDRDP